MSYFLGTIRQGSFVQVIGVRLSLSVTAGTRSAGPSLNSFSITDLSFAIRVELRQALAAFFSDKPVHERYRLRR
jgi:hypothetical protein